MNTLTKHIFFILAICLSTGASAQLTGIKNVPGDYPTLNDAITALNTQGVGAGGVTINLTPGTPQTAIPGGYAITATGTAANTITINGNGNTITASAAQTAGSVSDAIFKIGGGDYITLINLTMVENSANTVVAVLTNTMTEFGVVLARASASNGAQNNFVSNCTITLRGSTAYGNTMGIYMSARHDYNASFGTAVANATGGDNSNNTFSGNTISGVTNGIYTLAGTVRDDVANIITSNTITIGPNAVSTIFTTTYAGVATTNAEGVGVGGAINHTISNNNISNTGNTATASYGVYIFNPGTAVSVNTTAVQGNTINLNQNNTATTAVALTGILSAATTVNFNTAINISSNNIAISNGVNGNGAFSWITQTGTQGSINIQNNTFSSTGLAGTGAGTFISSSTNTPNVSVINNSTVGSIARSAASGALTCYTNGTSPGAGTELITGNSFTNISFNSASSGAFTGISTSTLTVQTKLVSGNNVSNLTLGTGAIALYNVNYLNASSIVENNTASSVTSGTATTGGTITGLTIGATSIAGTVRANTIYGLSSGGSAAIVTGIIMNGGTASNVFAERNNIYNLSATGSGAAAVRGIHLTGGVTNNVINNFVSGLTAPNANNAQAITGIFIASTGTNNIFHNTVALGFGAGLTGSAGAFGATGLVYASGAAANNILNNILYVNGTPTGTGTVAAVRRSVAGTAGAAPSTAVYNANANILYANTGAQNYLYAEGIATTALVNGYAVSGLSPNATNNIVNDINFNTGCGLYKAFMGGTREFGTFTENNLTPGAIAGLFAPSGISRAKTSALPTSPVTTVDFANTVRAATSDIGALEFVGTGSDATAPAISFTDIPSSYCVTQLVLSATISDPSGINTAPGTGPRLYYKKKTDADAISGNTSASNGWKYVQASNTSSPFSIAPDFNLLQTLPLPGDTIQYFVIAQDLAGTPNVGTNTAGFANGFCPTSVALPAAAFPLQITPPVKYFVIRNTPVLTVSASVSPICVSGATTLTVSGAVPDPFTSLLWETSTDNGMTWNVIPGATAATYTTPTLTASNSGVQYRASVLCASTVIAMSPAIAITVNNPVVTGTVPGTRCGIGTVTLGASGTAAVLSWYAGPAGGAILGTGSTFTTPSISSTTDFYVGAAFGTASNVGPASPAIGIASSSTIIVTTQYTLFDVFTPTTISSVKIYPTATIGSAFSISIRNSAGTEIFNTGTLLTTVTGGTTPQTVQLNASLAPGTAYRIGPGINPGLTRNTTGAVHPYTIPNVLSITGNSFDQAYWYYLYDWVVGVQCESPRVAVTATVTPAPPVSISGTATICDGQSTTLTASSPNDPNYVYSWTPGSTTGATQTFSPAANTTYTVTAQDTFSASANLGCVAVATATVNLLPVPKKPVISPDSLNACLNTIYTLTASTLNTDTIGSATTNSTTYSPYRNSTGGQRVQYLYTAAELTARGLVNGSTISELGFLVNTTGSYSLTGFNISLKNTPTTALTSTFETGTTNVFSLPVFTMNIAAIPQSTSHVLNTPWLWDGVSSLLIDFCWTNNNTGGGPAGAVYYTSTAANTITYFSASSNPSTCNTLTGTATTFRPNLGFRHTEPVTQVWSPTTDLYTDAAATVAYGGTNANILYLKPAAPGTTSYVVTKSAGTACDASDTVVVNAGAPLSVSVTSSATNFCAGGTTTLSAVLTGGGSPFSYSWSDGNNVVSTAQSFNVSPAATTTYTVTVTDACSGPVAASQTVVVNALPVVSVTPSSAFSCGTASVKLTAAGAPMLTWSVPVSAAYCTPPHTAVAGYITNFSLNTINNATPTAPPIPYYTNYTTTGTPTTTLTAGTSYTASVTIAASGITSIWIDYDQNGVFAPTEWVQPFTTGMTGSATISVPATAKNGVTRMRVRSRTVGSPNGSGDACLSFASGETEDYNVTITGGANPVTLFLDSLGTIPYISNTHAPVVWAKPAVVTTYTLTGTTASGCSSTINATVTPVALPAVTATASPATICAGGSSTLSATGSAGVTYAWTPAATLSPAIGAVVTATPADTTTYTVVATSTTGGCTNTSAVTVNVQHSGTWIGVTSTDWFTGSNWCGGVPTPATNVIIPAVAPFMPILTGSATVKSVSSTGDVQVSPSGALTIQP